MIDSILCTCIPWDRVRGNKGAYFLFLGLRRVRGQVIYDGHAVIPLGKLLHPIQDIISDDVILVAVVGVWTCRNLRGAENKS